MWRKQSPVEHVTDGTTAWADGPGFFIRVRGQVSTAIGTVLFGGAPWWWPEKLGAVTVHVAVGLTISIVIVGVFLVLVSGHLRYRKIRSLSMKRELHLFAHHLRDLHIRIRSGGTAIDILEVSSELCTRTRECVGLLTGKKHVIGVAIRIAKSSPNGVVFTTVGRAGLNQHRGASSADLPEDKGVARLFANEKSKQGILIYHDLKSASEAGAYELQPNDQKYPDDIKTLIVAPINGWDGQKLAMIGLLFITSRTEGVFRKDHADLVGFLADSLAIFYSDFAANAERLLSPPAVAANAIASASVRVNLGR